MNKNTESMKIIIYLAFQNKNKNNTLMMHRKLEMQKNTKDLHSFKIMMINKC